MLYFAPLVSGCLSPRLSYAMQLRFLVTEIASRDAYTSNNLKFLLLKFIAIEIYAGGYVDLLQFGRQNLLRPAGCSRLRCHRCARSAPGTPFPLLVPFRASAHQQPQPRRAWVEFQGSGAQERKGQKKEPSAAMYQ
jgi:hypothetical protein